MGLLPLLVLFAIPEDPDAALGQLDRHGKVSECRMEERIEKSLLVDHVHRFSPPKVLPALEGKSGELLPFLDHSSRRVILRAVELLCRTDGTEGPARVRSLALRYPCERELRFSAAVMNHDDTLGTIAKTCPDDPPPVMLAPARTLARWPADEAAAKAISSGDTAALDHALWNLEAIDPTRAQQAVATLARVDTARGVLATARGLILRLGRDGAGQVDSLLRGFLGAQLDALAAKTRTNRSTAWCLVVGAAAVDDYVLLGIVQSRISEGDRAQLEKEADKARLSSELTPFGRAWLEKLASAQHDWMAGRRRISTFVEHRDRPALRAYLKDETNGIADRLEAAKVFALLGDATGLVLWESAEGLWPEERTSRRALLVHLSHDAPVAVRTQAEALLTKRWPL